MKHRIRIKVPVEKKGLFGIRKTVYETRFIEVDGKTYRKLKKEQADRDIDELWMLFYDDLFGEEDGLF